MSTPPLTEAELNEQYEQLVQERNTLFEERKLIGLEPTYYVGNLDPSTQEDKIKSWFEGFGPVKSVRILRDQSGNSKRTGFVVFYYISSGTRACEELHGKFCDNTSTQPLIVRPERKFENRLKEIREGHAGPNSAGSGGGIGSSGSGLQSTGHSSHHHHHQGSSSLGGGNDNTGSWKVQSGRQNIKKDNNYLPTLSLPTQEMLMQQQQQQHQQHLAALMNPSLLAANPQYALLLQSQMLNPQLGLQGAGFPGAGGVPSTSLVPPSAPAFQPQTNTGRHDNYVQGAQVYVNNVADYATESQVHDVFKSFGRVLKVYVRPDQSYAIVSYDDPASALRAIEGTNGITVLAKPGAKLEVSLKSARKPKRN